MRYHLATNIVPTSTNANYGLKNLAPVPSKSYKLWSFRKANWDLYSLITNQLFQELPSPDCSSIDETYQDFCNTIFATEKLSTSRGSKNNYRPCWDAECKHLYQVFLHSSQVKQLVQFILMKNEKIAGAKLSITSTSRTPIAWHKT